MTLPFWAREQSAYNTALPNGRTIRECDLERIQVRMSTREGVLSAYLEESEISRDWRSNRRDEQQNGCSEEEESTLSRVRVSVVTSRCATDRIVSCSRCGGILGSPLI